MSVFSNNIISLNACTPQNIAKHLTEICNNYEEIVKLDINSDYLANDNAFGDIPFEVINFSSLLGE